MSDEDVENLRVAYLGLCGAMRAIVDEAPGVEPEFRDEFGYYVGSGNEDDVARDACAHAEWRLAARIADALFTHRANGAVDLPSPSISALTALE